MNKHVSTLLVASLLLVAPLVSSAASITLGSALTRQATLGNATSGFIIDGNPQVGDINAAFGGVWVKEGAVTANSGLTNDLLTLTIVGGWGQPVITGTWTIADSFFDTYGSAVISMHVGGANLAPDGFAWLTSGKTGTWSYDVNALRGGGLSNLALWGSGEPTTQVPDGSSTALLLGLGLVSFSIAGRRKLTQ